MGAVIITPLPSVLPEALQNSRAPSLHGHYPASSLLRTRPPPSRLRSTSRGRRLYDLPDSADFATGRGGLLQLLDTSWSPCCRSHPAGGHRRTSQPATTPAAFAPNPRARPPGFGLSGPPVRSLALRPGDSLTLLPRAWSMGFRALVSLRPAIRVTGPLALAPAGLTPAERVSLHWTHGFEPVFESRSRFRSDMYEVTRCLVPKNATRLKHAARCSFKLSRYWLKSRARNHRYQH